MSDQVNVGDYSLEISGDEVLVRDDSGAIIDTVEIDDVDGELTLPNGRTVDLASIFADSGVEAFQTAAGPANDNTGHVDDGSGTFTPFHGNQGTFDGLGSAGTLDGTSLAYGLAAEEDAPDQSEPVAQLQSSFDWSRHEPANSDETNPGGRQAPSNGTQSIEHVNEEQEDEDDADPDELPPHTTPPINEQQQPEDQEEDEPSTPPTDEQQQPEDQEEDEPSTPPANEQQQPEDQEEDESQDDEQPQPAAINAAPTDIDLAGTSVVENVSGAIIGNLTVVDPDTGDTHSFTVSDDRFEVVNGQLKLKDGVSLDFETEPSVEIIVTVTDQAGDQLAETFTIGVVDVNESSADINVTNSYEVWTSQLGNGKTTLDSGDDVLHINTDKVGPIDMGGGYDTVRLAKQGMSFGHNEAVKLSNVEAIDTTGYGANKVSLSIHDVLNMTDSDNHLTIIGDKGDTVTLAGHGKNQWTVIESGAEFTTYAYSDSNMQAIVEISNQMTTQVS